MMTRIEPEVSAMRSARLDPRTPAEIALDGVVRRIGPDILAAPAALEDIDRNGAILRIRRALQARSGKAWSVKGGRGTAWGWIRIEAPPRRLNEHGYMTDADRAELAKLLGLDSVHLQGVQVAASTDYRVEYVDRAEGRTPRRIGEPYWD